MAIPALAIRLLLDARALVERGYTRRTHARTTDDRHCLCDDPRAVAWSVLGALELVELSLVEAHGVAVVARAREVATGAIYRHLPCPNLNAWESAPERTQGDAVWLLSEAATALQQQSLLTPTPTHYTGLLPGVEALL